MFLRPKGRLGVAVFKLVPRHYPNACLTGCRTLWLVTTMESHRIVRLTMTNKWTAREEEDVPEAMRCLEQDAVYLHDML